MAKHRAVAVGDRALLERPGGYIVEVEVYYVEVDGAAWASVVNDPWNTGAYLVDPTDPNTTVL